MVKSMQGLLAPLTDSSRGYRLCNELWAQVRRSPGGGSHSSAMSTYPSCSSLRESLSRASARLPASGRARPGLDDALCLRGLQLWLREQPLFSGEAGYSALRLCPLGGERSANMITARLRPASGTQVRALAYSSPLLPAGVAPVQPVSPACSYCLPDRPVLRGRQRPTWPGRLLGAPLGCFCTGTCHTAT